MNATTETSGRCPNTRLLPVGDQYGQIYFAVRHAQALGRSAGCRECKTDRIAPAMTARV